MSDIIPHMPNDLANLDLENMSLEDILALGQQAQQAVQEQQAQQAAWSPVIKWTLSVPHSEAQSEFIPAVAKGALIMLERPCTEDELAQRKAEAAGGEVDPNYRIFAEIFPFFPFGRVHITVKNPATGYDMKRTARVAYHSEGKGEGVACSSSNGLYPNPKYIGTKVFEPRLGYEVTIGYGLNTGQPLRTPEGEPMPFCIGCPLAEWKLGNKTGDAPCSPQPDYVVYIPKGAPFFELHKVEAPTPAANANAKRKLPPRPVEFERRMVEFDGDFVSIRGRTSGMRNALDGRGDDLVGMMELFEQDSNGVSAVTPDGNPLLKADARINWAYMFHTSRQTEYTNKDGSKGTTTQYIIQPILGEDWNAGLSEDAERVPETMSREDYGMLYLKSLLQFKRDEIEKKMLRVDEVREGVKAAFNQVSPVFAVKKPDAADVTEGNIFDDDDDEIIDIDLDN